MSLLDATNRIDRAQQISGRYERLLYRSQFVLGPSFIDAIPSAQQLTIRPNWFLSAHPDLNVEVARDKEKLLVLLGFILDPDDPRASNGEIIENLVRNFDHCDDLFLLTARFGGRWILIAEDGDRFILFHDPAGLRQVFYSDLQTTPLLWCGSQPGIIAALLGLQANAEARDFILAPEISANPQYWWPGDSCLYSELKHLLPNHYLNLKTGIPHRFWPDGNVRTLSLVEAVQRCAALLSGLFESAANRFELVLPMTAGWDSRLLLAASKPVRHRISYFTLKIESAKLTDKHPDIAVPKALAGRLGLRHDVIEPPAAVDNGFAQVFDQNVSLPHDIWRRDAQTILDFYGLQKAVLSGAVSEVARHFYVLPGYVERQLTGEKLASLAAMREHAFAVKHFHRWLGTLGKTYNLRPLDLFYWEQRVGNWLAMCQKEFDIAWAEILTPYDCRLLMSDMLSVQRKYRVDPNYIFYRELILHLWPEVMSEPVNPHKTKSGMQRIKKSIRNQLSNVKHFVLQR